MRQFSIQKLGDVTRRRPLAIGLYGYTSTGKTESALKLAVGIALALGGEVMFVDTDGGRGAHYREMFPDIGYIQFDPPHNAMDYVALLEQLHKQGLERGVLYVVVIDQMTEEHDGEDGLLDTHEREKQGKESRNARAWGVAKGQHKKLVRTFRKVLADMVVIVTWRATDKIDWSAKDDSGKVKPAPVGMMPIGSRDLPFEMTATYLLPPGGRGAPNLKPETLGERMMTKIPRFFDGLIREGEQFDVVHGERMGEWSLGGAEQPAPSQPFPEWGTSEDESVQKTMHRIDSNMALLGIDDAKRPAMVLGKLKKIGRDVPASALVRDVPMADLQRVLIDLDEAIKARGIDPAGNTRRFTDRELREDQAREVLGSSRGPHTDQIRKLLVDDGLDPWVATRAIAMVNPEAATLQDIPTNQRDKVLANIFDIAEASNGGS